MSLVKGRELQIDIIRCLGFKFTCSLQNRLKESIPNFRLAGVDGNKLLVSLLTLPNI